MNFLEAPSQRADLLDRTFLGQPLRTLPVYILGAGRLGTYLTVALAAVGLPRIHLWNPRPLSATRLEALSQSLATYAPDVPVQQIWGPLEALLPLQGAGSEVRRGSPALFFLTVPDGGIAPLSLALAEALRDVPDGSGVAFHCSGASPVSLLSPLESVGLSGVGLHPLQTFTGAPHPQRFHQIYCALEGQGEGLELAQTLVALLDAQPLLLRPGGRTAYHAAAVVASNLTVALASLAVEVLGNATEADPATRLKVLLPLIEGTVKNLREPGLPRALTGPVSRGDAEVVARHLALLEGSPLQSVYRVLSLEALRLAQAQGLSSEKGAEVAEALSSPSSTG